MKLIRSITAPVVLILWCLAPAQAARKPKEEPLPTEPKAIFEQIDRSSARISENASDLHRLVTDQASYDMRSGKLDAMRADVNRIGKAIQSLEQQRTSLTSWEAKALDEIQPLAKDMGVNTERALEAFNITSAGLFATAFPDETEAVYKDASRIEELVRDESHREQ